MRIESNNIPRNMGTTALRAFCHIAENQGDGVRNIATTLETEIEAISFAVMELEERGLVHRDPESSLFLTAEGVRMVARMQSDAANTEQKEAA